MFVISSESGTCFSGRGDLFAQGCVFGFELRKLFADWREDILQLVHGVARGDVLRAVPVEAFDVNENDSFYDAGFVGGAEGFDECWSLGVVLVDFDAPENLETGLVGVVHEEEGYAVVMLEVAEADVLPVGAQIGESKEGRADDPDETFGA